MYTRYQKIRRSLETTARDSSCSLRAWCAPSRPPSKIPPIKFTDTTLENGLRVIISEDHYAPVYAIAVSYKVGSRDERKGRTGFAHLFEHMMFKGSENVGAGRAFLPDLHQRRQHERHHQQRPHPVLTRCCRRTSSTSACSWRRTGCGRSAITKENLENQRQAVKEERRLGVDNQPYGQTSEKLDELVYDNFAYQHSVIGSMADLDAASVEDVKQFFKTYYAPNNAVLALVGDLDTKETLAKVKKYFGAIPRQAAPKPVGPDGAGEERGAAREDRRQAGAPDAARHRLTASRRRATRIRGRFGRRA